MKRTLAGITALMICMSAFPVSAADTADVPAEIDSAAYAYLLEHVSWSTDQNKDGVISSDELKAATYIRLDLTDVKDISWFSLLTECTQLSLSGGELTDFSVLAQMPQLSVLSMDSVPLTDLSFMESLRLERCDLNEMPQITDEMRMQYIRFSDLTLTAGTMDLLSYLPNGLAKVTLEIKDGDTARFLGADRQSSSNYQSVYALKAGETTYSASVDGKVIAEKKITVKEAPAAANPPLQNRKLETVSIQRSYYFNPNPTTGNSGDVALINGTLYAFRGRRAMFVEADVKDYQSVYLRNNKGRYIYGDIILKTDGTVLVNGEDLLPEKCKEIRNEFMIGESGAFYGLVPQDDGFKVFKPTSDAAYFVPGCDRLYVNTKGSVRYYTSLSTSDRIFVGDTNVGEPVKTEAVGRQYYLLDKRGSLYLLDLSGSTLEKALIAEDVADIRWSESNVLEFESKKDGTVNEIVQIAYSSLGYQMHWSALDLDVGSFYIPDIQSETVTENDAVISYFIDKNKELRFRFQDETAGLTSVNCGICSTYDPETESGLIWFVREDGSIWYYDLKEKAWNEAALPAEETVSGDLNGDGRRSVADAVILCKYLCSDLAALPQWHTVDMDKNGILTAADLTLLKRELMK